MRVMKILVTGSSGHLGEAIVRTLKRTAHHVVGIDRTPSPFTTVVGTIVDRHVVERCMEDVDVVLHTATLHKPHVTTHTQQEFIDTNITGTLNLLAAAVSRRVSSFVFTSTTSTFGQALTPAVNEPAVWITEDVRPVPKNIYGVTKIAAEDLCELHHRRDGLACVVLRTSRFFPELDDNPALRAMYDDANVKTNEFLYRRVDLQDVVDAHVLAFEKAASLGFARYIISATTPFVADDLRELSSDAPRVVRRWIPEYVDVYAQLGWRMFPNIGRVYVNERARRDLGWQPHYDFRRIIEHLKEGEPHQSPLARVVTPKGYHDRLFTDGPYPVT